MPTQISEAQFEQDIEATLLAHGPDATDGVFATQIAERPPAYGEGTPGGYHRRKPEQYDRSLCLIPQDLVDFVQATQPKVWARLRKQHGEGVREAVVKRVSKEVGARGLATCLRDGVKMTGQKIRLAFFRPVSGLNEELKTLYEGNIFSVVRQLRYSDRNENSVDMVLFLNGLPFATAELKTPLTGQSVKNAIAQYRNDRDPSEPLFDPRRCLAHFALDPELAFVTTHLRGHKTRFLPFNQGRFGGAGNPPVQEGYATAYLWQRVWARDSVLNLIQHFVHVVDEEDDRGRATGKKTLIFPRYHQLDAVRRLVDDARRQGAGRRYLIQHSAGSGKSMSIAWLAHQLSSLHDAADRRVFDSIIVITDRRVLDRQLQKTVQSFEKVVGMVATIHDGSQQLREALESGKNIIVTTLQKFPYITEQIGQLPGKRFAVIVDEAHSSQSGEMTKSLKQVLATESLDEAEREDAMAADVEDQLVAEMKSRGPQPNVSTFAFTATPKPKTLELFGHRDDRGRYAPFSLYSMRQAIEEGFILDVLANYTTYQTLWKLLKTAEDDPSYERDKANRLLRAFVELHEHAIREKVRIMVEHFRHNVAHRINGRAKAMIVTRSRLHAIRYHRALQRYLKEQGLSYGALVAFSGTVRDAGVDYTESQLNGFPESQTKDAFERAENRFLVVANKFQTGFDQPLLHTMYVDKKLGGVNAVQTLSRLNRTYPGKEETMVLDFANDADEIKAAFEPYYEHTILSEGTNPDLLHDLENRIQDHGLFGPEEMDAFAKAYFQGDKGQSELYVILGPVRDRFVEHFQKEQQDQIRSDLNEYVRLYAFLSQILTFQDAELERLYLFSRYLKRILPVDREQLPKEIQEQIDIESYNVRLVHDAVSIEVARGKGEIEPRGPKGPKPPPEHEIERLSAIIQELNDRFGAGLTEEDRLSLEHLESRLTGDAGLQAAARSNTRENVRLTFEHKVRDQLADMAGSNFQLYKRITDDQAFGKALLDFLFEGFWKANRDE